MHFALFLYEIETFFLEKTKNYFFSRKKIRNFCPEKSILKLKPFFNKPKIGL
jgi:hypothetical protein